MKYRVPVTRDVTETANIIVEAETVEEAQGIAIAEARNDAGGNAYKWERDDCFNSEREPYIADPDAFIDVVQEPEPIGEAEGIAVLRNLLDAVEQLQRGEGVSTREMDATIAEARSYVEQLADDLFDRTDVDVRQPTVRPMGELIDEEAARAVAEGRHFNESLAPKPSDRPARCPTLVRAADAIIHQRDFHAENGRYDETAFRPDEDQCFDDWAADILQQSLRTDGIMVR